MLETQPKTLQSISVVIPCFNSPRTLQDLVDELVDVLKLSQEVDEFEVILVDDGGDEESKGVILQITESQPDVRSIQLTRNFGQHAATLAGCASANFSFVATLDDDGHHNPEHLLEMISRLKDGADIVYGIPRKPKHGFVRNIASQTLKKVLFPLVGAGHSSLVSSFRVLRREIIQDYLDKGVHTSVVLDVVISWVTSKRDHIFVNMRGSQAKKSRYSRAHLLGLATQMITGYSIRPLRVASFVGGLAAVAAITTGGYYLVQFFRGEIAVPGFASLALLVTSLGALQLITLGILGEYVGRVQSFSIGRPAYVVRGLPKKQANLVESKDAKKRNEVT